MIRFEGQCNSITLTESLPCLFQVFRILESIIYETHFDTPSYADSFILSEESYS